MCVQISQQRRVANGQEGAKAGFLLSMSKGSFWYSNFFPMDTSNISLQGIPCSEIVRVQGQKLEIPKILLDMDKGSPSMDIRNARRKKYIGIYNAQKHSNFFRYTDLPLSFCMLMLVLEDRVTMRFRICPLESTAILLYLLDL